MQQAVTGEIEVSILISASWPAWTKPISRFETIASISSWLSLGTIIEQRLRRRDNAADRMDRQLLTTHRSGAVNCWSLVFFSALIRSCASPLAFCSALVRSSESSCRYSASALCAGFANCGRGRFRLAQVAFLDAEVFLLLDQQPGGSRNK